MAKKSLLIILLLPLIGGTMLTFVWLIVFGLPKTLIATSALSRRIPRWRPVVCTSCMTATWLGQTYYTTNAPPTKVLDLTRKRLIALGVSESYFDTNFKLHEADASMESKNSQYYMEATWIYSVGYYNVPLRVTVAWSVLDNGGIEEIVLLYGAPERLREIRNTVSESTALRKSLGCLLSVDETNELPVLGIDGRLSVSVAGRAKTDASFFYRAVIDLESGELISCHQSKAVS